MRRAALLFASLALAGCGVPESKEPERFTLTAHVFENDGKLSWVIGSVDYAAYMTGNCPSQG